MRGTSAPWHWQGSAPASSTPPGIPSPLAHLPLLPWVLSRVTGSYSAAAQMSISERSSCDGVRAHVQVRNLQSHMPSESEAPTDRCGGRGTWSQGHFGDHGDPAHLAVRGPAQRTHSRPSDLGSWVADDWQVCVLSSVLTHQTQRPCPSSRRGAQVQAPGSGPGRSS